MNNRPGDGVFLRGFCVSLVLHALLLWYILQDGALFSGPARPQVAETFEVSLETPPRPRQIVSPDTPTPVEPPPPTTTLLAPTDTSTRRETVRRGESRGREAGASGAAPPPTAREVVVSRQNSETQSRRQAVKEKLDLTVRSIPADSTPVEANPLPEPFGRAAGSGATFLGTGGTLDHLPHLPDGDLTLLNAKASRYAVYVRRVATQVFGALRQTGWYDLQAVDVASVTTGAVVQARLSATGELLSVKSVTSSGSSRFDELLAAAVQRAARAPNPPPGAATQDGTYLFVFEARSWVQVHSSGRSGIPVERRWLQLGTGLE